MKVQFRNQLVILALAFATLVSVSAPVQARPSKSKAGNGAQTQTFKRQKNTLSNIDFYFTNKGVLFNNDAVAGLSWPRGTANSYIFGGGLWFATKKNIAGKRRKLVELGYNPNSGAGWFTEGEKNDPEAGTNDVGKYISYLSPRYSNTTGAYDRVPRSSVSDMSQNWPIWDTATTKTFKHNNYFGDYIASNAVRSSLAGTLKPNGDRILPAMLSQEDIVNVYSDEDVSANPEYKQGSGYPFGLNVVEVIYSWSFGRYRDMIFLRHKVTNASKDTLYDCFISPAFDPDLGVGGGAAANDHNSYFGLTHEDTLRARRVFEKNSIYYNDPTKLNMAYQWSEAEGGKQYGVIGFSFLESPVTAQGVVLDNSDSAAVNGYGAGAFPQLGLTTFKQWTIANDPPTPDLRYDFISDGSKDHDASIKADVRLLFATGPFTLPPDKSVETTVAIGIAQASTTTIDLSKDSIVRLINFAHTVFADSAGSYAATGDSNATVIKHFITPVPPEIPQVKTTSLDRGILVEWDHTSDNSVDPLSTTLPFNTYDLYRTTRSDHDSTIRPDGTNPIVHLGTWSVWDLRQDTLWQRDTLVVVSKSNNKDTTIITAKNLGFKYTRTNKTPHTIPHSFLDIGDDNQDGLINGSEGLLNGVKYYYYLLATDEYDSLNKVGPLTTAVVQPRNFVVGIPSRPVFPDFPTRIAGDISCLKGGWENGNLAVAGVDSITLDIIDTGKFLDLYSNDTVCVSFQPRWTEVFNPRFLNLSSLKLFVNVTDTRQGKELTYDKLYNPNATPAYTPYSTPTGILQEVLGQRLDSNILGRFTTDNSAFAPYQTIDQAFRVLVDYQFQQVKAPYRLRKVALESGSQADERIIHLSHRTLPAVQDSGDIDLKNIPEWASNPSFMGALGECSYEITFGDYTNLVEQEADTNGNLTTINSIKDPNSNVEFHPKVMPIYISSNTHCGAFLKPIRPGNRNDVVWEGDARFYISRTPSTDPTIFLASNNDPDSMIVPQPGRFAVDAFHFVEAQEGDPSTSTPILKTTGMFYYPYDKDNNVSNGQYLATVHRIRLAGAEIILNYPGINNSATTGDTIIASGPGSHEFAPGDRIVVEFTGLVRGLPMPDTCFTIYTSKDKQIDFASNDYYQEQKILDQVQVVPNPYIVTHLGQTSTDNAKLFFTRLPPRATIEIYTQAGDLVNTLEHHGYDQSSNSLSDRYNVEEWNLLSSGRQRVGSQVLIARIIAKDPNTDAVLGETTKKFAVILGGYRQVTGN